MYKSTITFVEKCNNDMIRSSWMHCGSK